MDPQRFQQIKRIFDDAADLPPERREDFIRERCADDPDLERSVRDLLRHHKTEDDLLEPALHAAHTPTGALTSADAGAPTLGPGAEVGQYTIESILGVGGFGVVYRARQHRPQRDVALKLIRPGVASPKTLRRFELEAELLARLNHPGIAQVYEVGTLQTPVGQQPFFAMELIDGLPLTDYADAHALSPRRRLLLFAQICDAVHHAHTKGILHRDLKPSNILVTGDGQVKILDFGVARALDSDLQLTTIQTEVGQLIGTIPYMSPEQAAANPDALDTRSDVYTLGVILYQLLAGRLPYDVARRMIHEAVRVIREKDPTRLSSLNKTFRGDVETIVGKALEKEPERRYQSAADLAADVRHYLSDEPISARPPSAAYQLRKFARRNRALVVGVAATFLVLVAGIIVSTAFAIRAERARADAVQARDEARENLQTAEQRTRELEKTAGFYAGLFKRVDQSTIGEDLAGDMRTRFTQETPSKGAPDISPEQFEAALQKVNPTDVALGVIDRNLLQPAGDTIDEEFSEDPLVAASLHGAIANAYQSLGLPRQAIPHLQKEVEARRSQLGPDNQLTLLSSWRLAQNYARLNMPADAEPILRTLAEEWKDDHERSAQVRSILASVLLMQGNITDGELTIREAIIDFDAAGLEDSVQGMRARFNLATILWRTGRIEEAKTMLDELLEDRTRVLGEAHDETLRTLDARAVMMAMTGNLDQAERDFRTELEISRRKLGDDHPQTLTAITNLGSLLRDKGQPEEALPLMKEAAYGLADRLGEDNRNALVAASNVASLLLALGRYDEAEQEARRLLAISRRAGIPNTDFTLSLLKATLAASLWNQGRFESAEPLLLEANDSLTATLGEQDPRTLRTTQSTAEMYEAWHQADPDAGHDAQAAKWRDKLPAPPEAEPAGDP